MILPRLVRLFLAAALVAGLAGVALVAQSAKPSAAKMADATTAFLGTLPADLRKKAMFEYGDPHRTAWYFTPQQDKNKNSTRKGLRFDALSETQKGAALAILKAGLSQKGYDQATTVMSLETILADLEGPGGGNTRNMNWYFVSVFGDPSATGKWAWRIEGHHLSVNVTLDKGEVVSATPMMFGSNPAEVKTGAKKGLRPLPEVEDIARELIKSLDAEQAKVARQEKQYAEIREKEATAGVGEPTGIAMAKLNEAQTATLWKLIDAYAARLPADIAADEIKRIKDAGADKVKFGYCIEEKKPGQPYTYRIQGPTFVVEFVNVQADSGKNPANHIHSAWRRLPADFGEK